MIHSVRKSLGEMGDKIDAGEKETIENAIRELEEADKGEDAEVIKAKTQALAEASHKLAEEMYKQASSEQAADTAGQAGEQGGSSAGADDNVVDAEFEEVEDDKSK